ncbi:PepSY-associated TM helix domain-containing protein [Rhodopseudomonas sp.]|uniref:PepSY-associated TM helix domain-containing protein n=1 Tax=Rhodopseudomonas sp. TaxID=1078 RepID=UPI0039E64C49
MNRIATRPFRRWHWVHKWSSIVCTVFLLMLCITGLPLIFHHEIDHLLHDEVAASAQPEGAPRADIDHVVASAIGAFPGTVPHFLIWDRDDPNVMMVSVGPSIEANPLNNRIVRVDAHTAAFLDAPDVTGRFTYIMLKLHTDMFAGLPGKLFLGLMGILFCAAVVSGVVVYAPSMRKHPFGEVRGDRPRVVRWLDLHNLAGILLVMWTMVVGLTGVISTWDDLILKLWQRGQLAEMTSQYRSRARPETLVPAQTAADVAARATPNMKVAFIAFPGTMFSSKSHYAVFMRGNTPVTSRLLKPSLIDAQTGMLTDSRVMPWYVTALFISQPLHFGDYGGMPLKILWALLDVLTIVVLVTGFYLWLRRRKHVERVQRVPADDVVSQPVPSS